MSVPKFYKTWGGGGELFHYSGSVNSGTVIDKGHPSEKLRAAIHKAAEAFWAEYHDPKWFTKEKSK